jgi:hypothetical protein
MNAGKLMSLSKYKRLIREEMQKIDIPPFYTACFLKHGVIQKLVRSKMELSKINKVVRFVLNSIVVLGYHSPIASNEETIVTLIEKDLNLKRRKLKLKRKNLKKIWK